MRDKNMGLKYKLPKHDFKTGGLKKGGLSPSEKEIILGDLIRLWEGRNQMSIVRRRFC
jgi:hypothetical protein